MFVSTLGQKLAKWSLLVTLKTSHPFYEFSSLYNS